VFMVAPFTSKKGRRADPNAQFVLSFPGMSMTAESARIWCAINARIHHPRRDAAADMNPADMTPAPARA